jgi:hypothetical protein
MGMQQGPGEPQGESLIPKPILDLQERDKEHFKPYLRRASELAKVLGIGLTDALLLMVLNFLVQLHSRPED